MTIKKLMTAGIILVLLCGCFLGVAAGNSVTIYSPDGDCIKVDESEVSVYAKWGWSKNIDDVRTLLYSTKGTAYVYNNQVSEYVKLGWSKTPVKVNNVSSLPVSVWHTSSNGVTGAIDITEFDITSISHNEDGQILMGYEYETNGSIDEDLFMQVYDSVGNKVAKYRLYIKSSQLTLPGNSAYFKVFCIPDDGHSSGEYIHRKQIGMHAPDGRGIYVYDLQAPAYRKVGWHDDVTMYAADGRTIEVPYYSVEDYKKVNWYTAEQRLYMLGEEIVNKCISEGKYIEAIVVAEEEIIPYLQNTSYAYKSVQLKHRAMDAWRNSVKCPMAVAGTETGSEYSIPTVSISFANVSYKEIAAFKVNFLCYNIFGELENSYYDYYYCDDADHKSGDVMTYTWKLYGADSINSVKNIRVTEIVFADGTKW